MVQVVVEACWAAVVVVQVVVDAWRALQMVGAGGEVLVGVPSPVGVVQMPSLVA